MRRRMMIGGEVEDPKAHPYLRNTLKGNGLFVAYTPTIYTDVRFSMYIPSNPGIHSLVYVKPKSKAIFNFFYDGSYGRIGAFTAIVSAGKQEFPKGGYKTIWGTTTNENTLSCILNVPYYARTATRSYSYFDSGLNGFYLMNREKDSTYGLLGKIWMFQILEKGVLVRDYKPQKNGTLKCKITGDVVTPYYPMEYGVDIEP